MGEAKYIHEEVLHNLEAPRAIVPKLVELFSPESVVDVGCGLGTFLHCFKEAGVAEVLGIDGPWVNADLRRKNLPDEEFKQVDLEQPFSVDKSFDLAISLEVAEHLSAAVADQFVENLTNLSDTIVFSAAIPNQGGQNHINEQWLEYWQAKFEQRGYILYDVLKPYFWNNEAVFWWYKQNMVLFSKKHLHLETPKVWTNIVHPELLAERTQLFYNTKQKYDNLVAGKAPLKQYLKLLIKKLFR